MCKQRGLIVLLVCCTVIVASAAATIAADTTPSVGSESPPADWWVNGDQSGAGFGEAIAPAGDVNGDGFGDILIGSPEYNGSLGRAGVFCGSDVGLGSSPAWLADGSAPPIRFGKHVESLGDVNRDGYDDVLVGTHSGAPIAHAFFGSDAGLSGIADWSVKPGFNGVASAAGDVNGDGYADVIIGMPLYGSTQRASAWGKASLHYGSAGGPEVAAGWTFEGNYNGGHVGNLARGIGDINGDGYGDIFLGGFIIDRDGERANTLFAGGASGPDDWPDWRILSKSRAVGGSARSRSTARIFSRGRSLLRVPQMTAPGSDFNGDGYDDLLSGKSVHYGSSDGPEQEAGWSTDLGWPVAPAGDVNGDGCDDMIIGEPDYGLGYTKEGRALVLLGSPDGLANDPIWTAESNQPYAFFGASVASAGDVNGDGYDDVIIGAPSYDYQGTNTGRVFLYLGPIGPTSEPSPTPTHTVTWTPTSTQVPTAIATERPTPAVTPTPPPISLPLLIREM